jgi:hypothetical protein
MEACQQDAERFFGFLENLVRENLAKPLRVVDINWDGFSSGLIWGGNQDSPNPRNRICDLLPPEILSLIESSTTGTSLCEGDKSTIVKTINSVLMQRDVYQERDFANVDLPGDVQGLLSRDRNDLSNRDIQTLNGLLFRASLDCCPDAAERIDDIRSLGKGAVQAVKKAARESDEIDELKKHRQSRLKTLRRWKDQADEWGYAELGAEITWLITGLQQAETEPRRSRQNEPYNKALERITGELERCRVEYASYMAMCALWYSGFSKMDGIGNAVPPPNDPIATYKERGHRFQGINQHLRTRVLRYEKAFIERLELWRKSQKSLMADEWQGSRPEWMPPSLYRLLLSRDHYAEYGEILEDIRRDIETPRRKRWKSPD